MRVLVFGDGQTEQRIPPEGLRVPFSIQLPNIPLPVSCTLNEGVVQYSLEGRLKQPWYTSDKTSRVPFTILPLPLDLMSVPAARIPSVTTAERTFGCCCCKSEPLIISARTPVTGWCMGDQVPVVVEIFNKSDTQVIDVTAQIIQVWTVYAVSRKLIIRSVRSKDHIVAVGTSCRRGAGVNPGDTEVWQFTIEVPLNILPTYFAQRGDIVRMQYGIKLELLTNRANLTASLPIIVGNTSLEPILVSEHSSLYEGIGS